MNIGFENTTFALFNMTSSINQAHFYPNTDMETDNYVGSTDSDTDNDVSVQLYISLPFKCREKERSFATATALLIPVKRIRLWGQLTIYSCSAFDLILSLTPVSICTQLGLPLTVALSNAP